MIRVRRRTVLLGASAAAAGLIALSRGARLPGLAPKRPPLIGFVANVGIDDTSLQDTVDGLRQGLRENGLVEGEDVRIEWRFAEGNNDLMPGLVAELLDLDVQLIVAGGGAPSFAVRQSARVPIVAIGGGGLPLGAASLSRPGGNVTGVIFPEQLQTKALEALKEVLPAARRLAYMSNPTNRSARPEVVVAEARQLQFEDLLTLDINTQDDLGPAFERASAWHADALLAQNVVPLNTPRGLLPSLALRWRLPAASQSVAWTDAGLLLSYSGSLWHAAHRAGWYAARILSGANTAEFPIEVTTVYDLTINRGTLERLGIIFPPNVAAQVTRWVG